MNIDGECLDEAGNCVGGNSEFEKEIEQGLGDYSGMLRNMLEKFQAMKTRLTYLE